LRKCSLSLVLAYDFKVAVIAACGIATETLLRCSLTLQSAFGPIPGTTIGLGTGPVHGTGSAFARLSPAPAPVAAPIEKLNNGPSNATVAMANALTRSCLFMVPPCHVMDRCREIRPQQQIHAVSLEFTALSRLLEHAARLCRADSSVR